MSSRRGPYVKQGRTVCQPMGDLMLTSGGPHIKHWETIYQAVGDRVLSTGGLHVKQGGPYMLSNGELYAEHQTLVS